MIFIKDMPSLIFLLFLIKKKTHKIKSKEAFLYFKPNTKSKTSKKLLFNSKITLTQQQGKFIKEDKYWIQKKDIEQIKNK